MAVVQLLDYKSSIQLQELTKQIHFVFLTHASITDDPCGRGRHYKLTTMYRCSSYMYLMVLSDDPLTT